MGERRTAAFQGEPGAFSHEACLSVVPGAEPTPFRTFEAALDAVREGTCEVAVIPMENSTAGPVPEVEDLVRRSGLEQIGEHFWRIRLQLLGLPDATLEDVEVISSHPMALGQCGRMLDRLGAAVEPAYDTAGAAADLARSGERRRAVVASRTAGDLYGLKRLLEDVEDSPTNTTRFIVLRRPERAGEGVAG